MDYVEPLRWTFDIPGLYLLNFWVFTLGLLVCMVLWMFISTRNIVTSSVIRPGIISGLTKKLKIIYSFL